MKGLEAFGCEDRPDRRCCDGDAKAGEFTVDAPVAPRRVLAGNLDDEIADLACGWWQTLPVRVGPVVRDQSSMPREERVGLHQEHRPPLPVERPCECSQERTVVPVEVRSGDLSAQHRELVTKHEDLNILRPV